MPTPSFLRNILLLGCRFPRNTTEDIHSGSSIFNSYKIIFTLQTFNIKEEYMEADIYRFMSFFEIYEMIVNRKLKMSKLSLMDDINEGIGSALKLQDSIIFGSSLIEDKVAFKKFHEDTMARTYISSWTQVPEAMSMWLLYSKDESSFRVKTNIEKLRICLNSFYTNNSISINFPEGRFMLDSPPCVEPVKYVVFEEVSKNIKKKSKHYLAELMKHDYTKFEADGIPKELSNIMNHNVISEKSGELLKDIAYSHENEIRASFTACFRSSLTTDEWEKNKNSDNSQYIFSTILCDYSNFEKLNDVVYIPINQDFVEEICFDPRMPSYKIKIFSEILGLEEKQINIVKSNSFGYKPNRFDF
jgi:hypothetical protein